MGTDKRFDKYERGRIEREEARLCHYDDEEFAATAFQFREVVAGLMEEMTRDQRQELVFIVMSLFAEDVGRE